MVNELPCSYVDFVEDAEFALWSLYVDFVEDVEIVMWCMWEKSKRALKLARVRWLSGVSKKKKQVVTCLGGLR